MDRLGPFLRAGIAVYNAGRYHAAHDAWEEYWLDLDAGPDERLLHGLIQFTAAVHHADEGNPEGATGLAASAQGYLDGLPPDYRGVNVDAVRTWLGRLERDPDLLAAEAPLPLRHEGRPLRFEDLAFPATGIAAEVIAEADGLDEAPIERAVAYLRGRDDVDRRSALEPLLGRFLTAADRSAALERIERRLGTLDPDTDR